MPSAADDRRRHPDRSGEESRHDVADQGHRARRNPALERARSRHARLRQRARAARRHRGPAGRPPGVLLRHLLRPQPERVVGPRRPRPRRRHALLRHAGAALHDRRGRRDRRDLELQGRADDRLHQRRGHHSVQRHRPVAGKQPRALLRPRRDSWWCRRQGASSCPTNTGPSLYEFNRDGTLHRAFTTPGQPGPANGAGRATTSPATWATPRASGPTAASRAWR